MSFIETLKLEYCIESTPKIYGYCSDNKKAFRDYIQKRLVDKLKEALKEVKELLEEVSSTGFETPQINLTSYVRRDWEVGELLAVCLLEDIHYINKNLDQIIFPRVSFIDKRNPTANLQGFDLVGLYKSENGWVLLFGEVKTTTENSIPPKLAYALKQELMAISDLDDRTSKDKRQLSIQWLLTKCENIAKGITKEALKSYYLNNSYAVIGVLLRDTAPDDGDCRPMLNNIHSDNLVIVFAFYLPIPIVNWSAVFSEVAECGLA